MKADVYAAFRVLNDKLNRILKLLGEEVMPGLDELRAEVERNTSADEGARTLLYGLAAKVQELIDASGDSVDPVELQALVDQLKGSTDTLVDAVVANTPADAGQTQFRR